MAKRKPKQSEPVAKRNFREPGPEDDLRHCILYLVTFGGSSLEELSKATGIEFDTVDRYMVGKEPVTRELVEQFCKIAGTSLPRVELALPLVRWPFKLVTLKKIPTTAETERETQIEIKALEIAYSAYDSFLAGLRIRGGPHASALDASFQSLAGKYASLAAEAYRVKARAGQRSEMAALASKDSEDGDD